MNSKIAILIFANSAEKEAVLKPFQFSKEVFNKLNKQTISIAKKTGLPYFVFSEKQQIGNSFGERFTNAIQSVYNKGYNAVITIGNDTPHLTTNHILKTVKGLQKNDIVLGPSADGGFYIMGLKKSQFNAKAFLQLPWQTSQLNKSLSKLKTTDEKSIGFLEVLTDLDDSKDIKTIINGSFLLLKPIKKVLIKCIFINKKIITSLFSSNTRFQLNLFLNKGSPPYSY